jgi:thiamine transport system substrate-binding protein
VTATVRSSSRTRRARPPRCCSRPSRLDTAPTGVILDTCYRQVEYVGILATTSRPDDARRLVDFLLSPAFQADVPLTMFVFPARTDVALPDVFAAHAVLPERPLVMDPERIDAGREGWIARFAATVLR